MLINNHLNIWEWKSREKKPFKFDDFENLDRLSEKTRSQQYISLIMLKSIRNTYKIFRYYLSNLGLVLIS